MGWTTIPYAIRLMNGIILQGALKSNELEDVDHMPLVMSLAAQMTFGL